MLSMLVAFALAASAILAACGRAPRPATAPDGSPAFASGTPMIAQPWPVDRAKFSFAILGDKADGMDNNWPVFDRAVDEINRLRPDFVICVGDLIQGSREPDSVAAQWTRFRSHAERLAVPFLLVPGNHDMADTAGSDYWRRNVGRTHYDFTYKGAHFVVLNTQEDMARWPAFGEVQVAWAIRVLSTPEARRARHTFVLMHVPNWRRDTWLDPRVPPEEILPWIEREREAYAEWLRIEEALGDRPYTVFGGHYHTLRHEIRNDRRYFVHGATGGDIGGEQIRELGSFHHFTHVVVEGDSAHVAFIEPGSVWHETVAPWWFAERLQRAFGRPDAVMRDLGGGRATIEFAIPIRNDLPDSIALTFRAAPVARSTWRAPADSVRHIIPPGGARPAAISFEGRFGAWYPLPQFTVTAEYDGNHLFTEGPAEINPFPSLSRAIVPEWEVIGPFPVGSIYRSALPTDPRRAMPGAFRSRGPDAGWAPGASYEEEGRTYEWRRAIADTAGSIAFDPVFGAADNHLAYAACAIWSPVDQRVAVAVGADNFFQVFVNGALAENGERFTRPYDTAYAPLDLRAGWNTVLVKVINNRANWGMRVQVHDFAGNLRFASHVPED